MRSSWTDQRRLDILCYASHGVCMLKLQPSVTMSDKLHMGLVARFEQGGCSTAPQEIPVAPGSKPHEVPWNSYLAMLLQVQSRIESQEIRSLWPLPSKVSLLVFCDASQTLNCKGMDSHEGAIFWLWKVPRCLRKKWNQ
eukprot:1844011-Amphidinium_carterae.1